ncbi:MAG TPA: 2-dehydropantoate 2-reductase [Vicinamibacterales bacterium]|nr:2-dehydropantoate 2-reductase [Vicinamibacterales bacterium]
MKIAIFGSGGVGGYFGGRLAAAGEDVTFLARGAHLNAMQKGGLHIASPLGDVHVPSVQATDRPQAIGPVDVVLFTVKLYDVDASAATLSPLIGQDTVVITLQNGVDAMDMVAKHVGDDHVAGGAAYIVAVIDQPGHIRHTTAQQLVFGERNGRRSDRLIAFEEAGKRAGFQANASADVVSDLWVKFVRLATWSGMTTVTRSPMGVVRDTPATFELMIAAIEEVIAVGKARGVNLPRDLMDTTLTMIKNFPAASKSSMLEDIERGRRLELPWLSGAVVRIGKEVGVATPIHQFITTILTPFVGGSSQR